MQSFTTPSARCTPTTSCRPSPAAKAWNCSRHAAVNTLRCPVVPARWRVHVRAGAGERDAGISLEDKEELETKMEEFLRKQAEKESGAPGVGEVATPVQAPIGTEVVSEEEAKQFCRDIVRMVKMLRENRDMSVSEIKLTIAIESPSEREQREYMGIENDSGISRDEMAAALMEVTAGRIPKDRIALRELYREMASWPFLDDPGTQAATPEAASPSSSPYREITDTGAAAQAGWRGGQARPKLMGRDKSEKPQGLVDMLPDWMGYGFLYLVSSIPVLIAGTVIAILFFNSLR